MKAHLRLKSNNVIFIIDFIVFTTIFHKTIAIDKHLQTPLDINTLHYQSQHGPFVLAKLSPAKISTEIRNSDKFSYTNSNLSKQFNVALTNSLVFSTSLCLGIEDIFIALFLILLILTTIVGNVLVVLSVFLYKRMRTFNNFLLTSLATADLLVGLLIMPLSLIDLLFNHNWPFGRFLCRIWATSDVMLCTASILNLCIISLDRYMAITSPLKYPRTRSRVMACCLLCFVWGTAIIVCSPPWFIAKWGIFFNNSKNIIAETTRNFIPTGFVCAYSPSVPYRIYSALVSFYIPLMVMLSVYFKIFRVASERERLMREGLGTCRLSRRVEKTQRKYYNNKKISSLSNNCHIRSHSTSLVTQSHLLDRPSLAKYLPTSSVDVNNIVNNTSNGVPLKIDLSILSYQTELPYKNQTGKKTNVQNSIRKSRSSVNNFVVQSNINNDMKNNSHSTISSSPSSSVSNTETVVEKQYVVNNDASKSRLHAPGGTNVILALPCFSTREAKTTTATVMTTCFDDVKSYNQTSSLPYADCVEVSSNHSLNCKESTVKTGSDLSSFSKNELLSYASIHLTSSVNNLTKKSKTLQDNVDTSNKVPVFSSSASNSSTLSSSSSTNCSYSYGKNREKEVFTTSTANRVEMGSSFNCAFSTASIHQQSQRLCCSYDHQKIPFGNQQQNMFISNRLQPVNLLAKAQQHYQTNGPGKNIRGSKEKIVYLRERKALKTIGIVVLGFIVCWMPFFVVYLVEVFINNVSASYTFKLLNELFLWLGYSNSVLNPIIYTMYNGDFRRCFRDLLGFGCVQHHRRTMSVKKLHQQSTLF